MNARTGIARQGGGYQAMTYIITQPCIGVKDASCVDVCPVDCIHPSSSEPDFDENEQLYINPDECIDCGACEPACPVTAIFEESAVPDEWKSFIKVNADFFK
jgi:NAD-dependent dihydropyrimidine dehydrogenase PreA subunit